MDVIGQQEATRHAGNCADKELTQVYPQASVEIQMLCEAAMYADLLPIYKILAMGGRLHPCCPLGYPRAARMRLRLEGRSPADVNDLTAGFSLLLFIAGSTEATTQAPDQTVVYSLLHGGHVAPSLLGSTPGDRLRGPADGSHPHCLRTLLSAGLQ